MNDQYKCTGSVINWVLNNNLEDAFSVWMVAQNYNRSKKYIGEATGYISSPFFLQHVAQCMSVQDKTAERRLKKAVDHGFLTPIAKNKYIRIRRYIRLNSYLRQVDLEVCKKICL